MKKFLAGLVLMLATLGIAIAAGPAGAADSTHWLCKPGQADNPCLGDLDGKAQLADGTTPDLGYVADPDPPVDCFYVYPTQSPQTTANADLSPDKPIRDVAINQARQFSRVCDVYAPLYRQYTFEAPVTDEVRDIAYEGVLQGWKDYLENYNDGRGVIIIGHSQGSSHLGRLLQEEIDNNPSARDRLISAIIPGANVFVPKGQPVGGEFQNIPACESADQLGCVIAYSAYLNEPPVGSSFGRIESGYWINPMPRPDPATFEVLCVNPADLTGGGLDVLANLQVFLGGSEGPNPWTAQPDVAKGECMNQNDASWLNVTPNGPPDWRPDLSDFVAEPDGNLHLGDINLALDNLVSIAGTEADAYAVREGLLTDRKAAKKKLSKKQKQLRKQKKKSRKVGKKAKVAGKKCRAAKKSGRPAKAKCNSQRKLERKQKKAGKRIKKSKRQVKSLKKQIARLDRQLA